MALVVLEVLDVLDVLEVIYVLDVLDVCSACVPRALLGDRARVVEILRCARALRVSTLGFAF